MIRALTGVAEGPTWSIMMALIEDSSRPSRRGRNIGLVLSATALVGLGAAPVLPTQVAAHWGWWLARPVCYGFSDLEVSCKSLRRAAGSHMGSLR